MTGGRGSVFSAWTGEVSAGEDLVKGEVGVGLVPTGVPDKGPGVAGLRGSGVEEHPTRLPTITANIPAAQPRGNERNGILRMALILLEALLALILIVAIVWWTMFSGRSKGELPPVDKSDSDDKTS